MTTYQFLIPEITIVLGIFFVGISHAVRGEKSLGAQWIIQIFVLILAFFQELLMYRVPSTVFVDGGMILDGTTEILSISILILSIIFELNRHKEKHQLVPQVNLLTLGSTLFSLLAVQSNRIFFGLIAIVGLIWTSQAALAAESRSDDQPDIVHSGIVRGLIFLVTGVFFLVLCFGAFGETQIDEMQRVLARGHFGSESVLFPMEILVLFLGAVTMGLPPFDSLFGRSRKKASWSLSLGMSGLFAVVGFNIFVRWGFLVFARPAIGAMEYEPLTSLSILETVRILSAAGLVLTPMLAVANRSLRGSLLFFALNPFVQGLFALSFGQREVMGFVEGQIFASVLILGLMISALSALALPWDFPIQKWVGIGRRNRAATLSVLLALTAAAGLSPFFGGVTIQKTLSINSYYSAFLLANVALAGFYVARMVIFAFHRADEEVKPIEISGAQRAWFVSQVILLIFLGIFWQPLYKYGAYSIRSFFGEI